MAVLPIRLYGRAEEVQERPRNRPRERERERIRPLSRYPVLSEFPP